MSRTPGRWLVAAVCVLIATSVVAQAPAKKPNIILIVSDDFGY